MSDDELKRDYREDLTLFEGPWSRGLAALLVLALGLYSQLLAGDYVLFLMINVSVFIIAAVGLNLLVGYTGQISLGHAAFMAIGAYTHMILYARGLVFPLSVLAGASVAGILGFLVGIPALRLKGPYLAIATLGFQVATDQILGRWDSLTGGRMGLETFPPSLFGVVLDRPQFFLLCLVVTVGVLVGSYNLTRSRIGRAFVAIRDNETAAESMGVGLTHYKTMAFAISAFVTGIAGALFAHLSDRINPSTFNLLLSIEMLVMVLLGGLASILGSVLGASFIVLIPHVFSGANEYQAIVVGVILIAVLLFEPMGMRGRWLRMKYYFKAWPF